MDRLSNLPDHVVDKILCSLPLFDAVQTCVLARAWRYKWVTLSKLTFDCGFWDRVKSEEDFDIYIAILLQHTGQLQELDLTIYWDLDTKRNIALDTSIQVALRKGVTKLRLYQYPGIMPCSVYCSAQLTHLKLEAYDTFSLPASFCGMPNLISFKLIGDSIDSIYDADDISTFISKCPNIQSISLDVGVDKKLQIHAPKLKYLTVRGDITCMCLHGTKNLKYLDLNYSTEGIDICPGGCWRNFNCLVKLKHLKLRDELFQHMFSSPKVPRRLPQTFEHLKTLELGPVCFANSNELKGLLWLFASSPNLCKLTVDLEQYDDDYCEVVEEFESNLDLYRDHKFKCLRTIDIRTRGFKLDIKMIGFLLCCSPCLELMSINLVSCKDLVNTVVEVTKLTRASPKASVKCWGVGITY